MLLNSPGANYIRFGKVQSPAFLWLQRGEGDPITGIKVLLASEAVPEGYTKINDSLSSSGQQVFLAYEKNAKGSPVIDLKVVTR